RRDPEHRACRREVSGPRFARAGRGHSQRTDEHDDDGESSAHHKRPIMPTVGTHTVSGYADSETLKKCSTPTSAKALRCAVIITSTPAAPRIPGAICAVIRSLVNTNSGRPAPRYGRSVPVRTR